MIKMMMMTIGIVRILNCPTAPSQEREVVQWLGLKLKHIGDDDDRDDGDDDGHQMVIRW